MSKRMTVADYVVNQARHWGVTHAFGIPGDTILPLMEAVAQDEGIEFVVTRSEAAAGLMASAFGKLTGKMAICAADAGPGSVQLLNGVYDAKMDRVPLLAVTGQVETKRIGTSWPQAVDLDHTFKDATVYNQTVIDPGQAQTVVRTALRKASFIGGPARLGLPMNVQREEIPLPRLVNREEIDQVPWPDRHLIEAAVHELENSLRPLIFVGRGCTGVGRAVIQLAEKLGAGIVHSLPSTGSIPADHPLNLGVVGDFGNQGAADALAEADTVLVLGATWWQPRYVSRGAKFIQVDSVREHLGMVFPAAISILGRVEQTVEEIVKIIRPRRKPGWQNFLDGARSDWDREVRQAEESQGTPIPPARVITELSRSLAPDAVVALDVGNNTLWFGRYFRPRQQTVVLSGHWRAVGFALPAAIAAKLVYPGRQVVAVTGDGGLGMHLAEFTTAVGHNLDIKVVVLRDEWYGEEAYYQKKWGLRRYGIEFANPSFAAYAEAAGGLGLRASDPGQLKEGLGKLLREKAPAILEVKIDRVLPERPTPLAERSERPEAVTERA